jgi:hypothetical protein
MIAVSERDDADSGVTATGISDWLARGRSLVQINSGVRSPTAPGKGSPASFHRPVVFFWPLDDCGQMDTLQQDLARMFGSTLVVASKVSRNMRRASVAVATDIRQAVLIARAGLYESRRAEAPLRIICDYGPVLDHRSRMSDQSLGRLPGARDLAGFPAGKILATTSFAAQIRFELDHVRLIPIGRGPAAGAAPVKSQAASVLPSGEIYTFSDDLGEREPN